MNEVPSVKSEFLDEKMHVLQRNADSHEAENPSIEETLRNDVELILSKDKSTIFIIRSLTLTSSISMIVD